MTTYECIRCGSRYEPGDTRLTAGRHTCPACGGALRDVALPME